MGKKKNIIELTNCSVRQYREKSKFPLVVVADNIRSMHNVGSLFRTGDAFLVEEIVLCGITGTPPHPEISKTALGAEESVTWRYEASSVEAVRRLREDGYVVCVLEQAHGSVPLQDFDVRSGCRYVVVAGNEVEGVDQDIVDMADFVLEIPQFGVKHSLNVSVSSGIALWHFFSGFLENGYGG